MTEPNQEQRTELGAIVRLEPAQERRRISVSPETVAQLEQSGAYSLARLMRGRLQQTGGASLQISGVARPSEPSS
jgi:hypothetical protein